MSASSRPTLSPNRASATAIFAATVDLPTPPLPLPTAMMCLVPSSRTRPVFSPSSASIRCTRKLDLWHAEVVRERVMDIGGELANHLVALGDLPQRDRVAAVRRRLGILDDSKRNNVGGVTGILYVSERLDNRIVRYLSCH